GTAEVVRLLDAALVEGDVPLAAGGVVLRLRGVAPLALAFPRGAALNRALRTAALAGELPAEAGKAWLDSGAHEGEAFLKLFVPRPEGWRRLGAEVRQAALTTGAAVVDFLRRRPEFSRAHVVTAGALGVREGGRIRGEHRLTGEDVRRGR